MVNDDIINDMEGLKQCVEGLILFTQSQEMPVVQSTIKVSQDIDIIESIETALNIISNSHLSKTHEVNSNLMTTMKNLPYREFRLTISII